MEIILHRHTQQHITQFITHPSHAVLLVGSNGVGKTHLAEKMLRSVLPLKDYTLRQYPYFRIIQSDKGSISIETIRELQRFLQLKTIGSEPLRRAVIVEHAETLTIEAQNAFLKLLEEPPADTIIILTADNQRALLPTILSRVQIVPIVAPDETTIKNHFSTQGKDGTTINQAYFLSGGLPGLMSALLAEDSTHPLLDGVKAAKEILQKTLFDRLALVENYSKQKEAAIYMVEALQHIAQTGLNQAAAKADAAKVKQWHHILKVSQEALEALAQNANTKLVLDAMMLSI